MTDRSFKKLTVLSGTLVLAAILWLAILYVQSQKRVKSLASEKKELQGRLKIAKNKVSELEADVAELKSSLANVKHFDDDGTIGHGYSRGAVNYTDSVIETQIDGDFEGWDGETIFKMMDGSIWQQASYDYTYSYAYMPDVIIYGKGGAYFYAG